MPNEDGLARILPLGSWTRPVEESQPVIRHPQGGGSAGVIDDSGDGLLVQGDVAVGSLYRHPVATYLATLAPSGRRTMAQALERAAAILSGGRADAWRLDWPALRYQHLAALRGQLQGDLAPASANKILAAVRRVLKECWRLGYLDAEVYQRACDVEPVRGRALPRGRMLSEGELRALRAACEDGSVRGIRDLALLAVMARGGLRRAEVVSLAVGDVQEVEPGVGMLQVRGKGAKEREVPLANGAWEALARWLEVRGQKAGPVFRPVQKDGVIVERSLSTQAIYGALQRLAARAEVAAFTPHDLRRTAGSELLENGVDLSVVAGILGHADPGVTARVYDRRRERAALRAARRTRF